MKRTKPEPAVELFKARSLCVILLSGLMAFAIGLFYLTEDARLQFNKLATASSDNRQWNLAQAEVEYLRFQNAVLSAYAAGQPDPAQMADVRLRFDVFYSRMMTIREGSTLAVTRRNANVAVRIDRVIQVMDGFIPSIDSGDQVLFGAFPGFIKVFPAAFEDVRQLSLLESDAISNDALEQRASVTQAFKNLGILTVALVVLLLALVAALLEFIRRERLQARRNAVIQNRMTSIIETAIEGLVAISPDGKIIEFNPAAAQIFGYSEQEALGADLGQLLVPQSFRPAFQAALASTRANGHHELIGAGAIQVEAMRKNGDRFPAEVSVSATTGAEGAMYFAFVRDISERVAAQREIEEARDRALAGEKAKSEFLAVMSHEMRTPLNGILGTLELMQATGMDAKQKMYAEVIASSGTLLLQHVNSVLDISKVDANRMTLSRKEFGLQALLREVIDGQKATAAARSNVLDLKIDAPPDRVFGDQLRIKQVLINLLANAVKFTENGQIHIEVKLAPGSELVEFRVADTGVGIAETDLERVFHDFVMLDPSFSRAAEGTGLGLGICKRLVQVMGGEIGVDSQEGVGSTFWFRLPLPAAERLPELATPAPKPKDFPQFGLSVLVVEDNRINRMVVREMLIKFGCAVVEAVNGKEGVKAAAADRYDLILMDISMPVMDGVTATSQIRASGLNPATPIYALTAHAQPEEIESFQSAGVAETIVKPLNSKRLRETLEKVVQA